VYEHGRGFAYRWGWFATGPGHGYHTPRNTPVPWAGRLVVPYNKQISSFKFSSTLTIKEPVEDFRFQRTEGTLRYTVENLEYPSETVTGEERVHGPDYRIGSSFSTHGGGAGVLLSDDHGKTWRRGGSIPMITSNEAMVEGLKNGSLIMSFRRQDRRQGDGCRWLSYSHDGGESWGQPFHPRGRHHRSGLWDSCEAPVLPGYALGYVL